MEQDAYLSILRQGTVTLTTISNSKLAGTFSFTGLNGTGASHTISNGSFEVDL